MILPPLFHEPDEMSVETKLQNKADHIGIIMDGNGRWAQSRGLSRIKGHQQGVETCRRVIDACQDLDVHFLTLYAFSAENWKRPETEVNALMELLEFFIKRELKTLKKKGIRFRAIGRLEGLPSSARRAVEKAMDETREFTKWNLTLALNYSSRNEIVDAAKKIGQAMAEGKISADDIEWETFASKLYTHDLPDPDLIIRTSGENRLSNFLMMQAAYSEFYFTETAWPDFSKAHLAEAIDTFEHRERRYGLTGDQLTKLKKSEAAT
ncbi:MAG: isoprenyl transferase [Verrucomicrobiota bacterium]